MINLSQHAKDKPMHWSIWPYNMECLWSKFVYSCKALILDIGRIIKSIWSNWKPSTSIWPLHKKWRTQISIEGSHTKIETRDSPNIEWKNRICDFCWPLNTTNTMSRFPIICQKLPMRMTSIPITIRMLFAHQLDYRTKLMEDPKTELRKQTFYY